MSENKIENQPAQAPANHATDISNYAFDLMKSAVSGLTNNNVERALTGAAEGAAFGAIVGGMGLGARSVLRSVIEGSINGGAAGAPGGAIEGAPNRQGLGHLEIGPGDKINQGRDIKDILRGKEPIDREPVYKFRPDKPLDAKEAAEYAEKVGKWVKADLLDKGSLSGNVRDRLTEALSYGIRNGGQQGLKEMVELLNKQLAGTGFEIKTDGKPFSYYQSCFPDRRGDYHGDFVSFDIRKGDKQADSGWVQVKEGDIKRLGR